MRNELVNRLTHVGHRYLPASLPNHGHLGQVSEPAVAVLSTMVAVVAALAVLVTAGLLAAALATGVAGLPAHPLAGWLGVVVATAATPALVRRVLTRSRDRP